MAIFNLRRALASQQPEDSSRVPTIWTASGSASFQLACRRYGAERFRGAESSLPRRPQSKPQSGR